MKVIKADRNKWMRRENGIERKVSKIAKNIYSFHSYSIKYYLYIDRPKKAWTEFN